MADITISDLELAPALTDDMVLPVENTTDTYAATLAMLRRLINKTFVEVENADFNALTDDGFYQCTGTPTNSPVAGAVNWTLQVSAESGVVVQRAFSLDDNFANIYIRRWNGVTWTGWLSNTVTTDTAQTISGTKTFPSGNLRAINPILLKENDADEGGQIIFERSGNSVLKTNPYIDLLINSIRFIGVNSQNVLHIPLTVDFENGKIYSITPPADAINNEVINAEWVNTKKETIVGWGRPNWRAVIGVSTGYVAVKNGWGIGTLYSDWGGASGYLYVNGVEVASNAHAAGGSGKGHDNTFIFPMSKGDKMTASGSFKDLLFAPDKE